MRTTLLCLALLLPLAAPLALAEGATDSDSFLFVTFELGDVRAKETLNGVLHATYNGATTETTIAGRAGEPIQASLSLPANSTAGDWSVELRDLQQASLFTVAGRLTSDGIQILTSNVDSNRIDLPRDTTSLRVIKGYVSATVTLIGQLERAGCCNATLGIDANADGTVSPQETQTVHATGSEVRVTVSLPRAAPSVPYVFTIQTPDGRTVARASGTYSFTKLNGVSAAGEFDPEIVEYVTGSVERQPHLVQHDIGSSILLQTVAGSAREEDGPRVFFTMGTPRTESTGSEGAGTDAGSARAEPSEQSATPAQAPGPSLGQRILALFTGPIFLAILLGSFLAAGLAFAARRMMDRAN